MTTRQYETATIAIGTTTSDQVNLRGLEAGVIIFPATFTGATITFEIPDGAGGWATLDAVSLTKVLSKGVALTLAQAFALGDDFRIVSASTEASGERILYVAVR